MSPKKVLVTGVAGFIGSHLAERLLAEGNEVIGVDSFEDFYPRELKEANLAAFREHPAFRFVEANILELGREASGGDAWGVAAAQISGVVHLAAQAGVRDSWGTSFDIYTTNNVLATQVLLERFKGTAIDRFVYASSSSVYGDTDVFPMREDARCEPFSPYGVTKLAAEHLAKLYWRNFGLPTVSLRFFTVYGPRQRPDMAFSRFARALLEGRELEVYGDGRQTRDFTYIDDIVDGIMLALEGPPGGVFNLGGGSRVSLLEAIDVLGKAAGVEPRVELRDKQAGDVRDTSASLDLAWDVLGYSPKVPLDEGLAAEVAWMRELLGT
jgi:nucleoside-diphosphate-sugar epimerase